MTAPSPRARGEQGFALAETLVAAAIMAAALGVTYEAIQTTAWTTTRLREQRMATLIGTSVLARVGADIALSPGDVDGEDSDYAWHVEVEPYQSEGPQRRPARLFAVTVRVGGADGAPPLCEIKTLRIQS